MDPRLLDYYNRELQYIREMGGEFAREFPKIAGRLSLEGFDCRDPYVERLLEGFAFLAARVQLKIDAEFPRFTRHLLEMVYPHYLAPTPSMAVVRFEPDLSVGDLAKGVVIPRHTALRSRLGQDEQTACEYRTAHQTTLWPLELTEAEYFTHAPRVGELDFPGKHRVKAGIRLTLRATAGMTFEQLSLQALPLYMRGSEEMPVHLLEQFLANTVAVVALPLSGTGGGHELLEAPHAVGYDDDQALLPYGQRSFQGYRLLHEYFAFPQRYLFAELRGLDRATRRCAGSELELLLLFDRIDPLLENAVDASHFGLFCTPAVNLFPKRADRIHLDEGKSEYQVIPDRTRPLDFEVYAVTEAMGHGTASDVKQPFYPFYATYDRPTEAESSAYYAIERAATVLSDKQRRVGTRSTYVGSDLFLSLVDAGEAPYSSSLRQLSLELLCTNRDLPLQMSVGSGATDFTMEISAPVNSVRCIVGPSPPRPGYPDGDVAWRLVSHLGLNYHSLVGTGADSESQGDASSLRELLRLYNPGSEAGVARQIDGVRSVTARRVTGRLPLPGPVAFGRGLQIEVTLDGQDFEGVGAFLLGAVLDRFFARYVSINSFTETIVSTLDRGEIVRWPARIGQRHRL